MLVANGVIVLLENIVILLVASVVIVLVLSGREKFCKPCTFCAGEQILKYHYFWTPKVGPEGNWPYTTGCGPNVRSRLDRTATCGRPVVGRLVGLLPLGTVGHAGAPGQAGAGGSGGGYTVYGTWS